MLGGLWPLAGGRILKPGGGSDSDGLSHDIFYVPQRPYVNTGTLQEQLIYPTALAGVRSALRSDRRADPAIGIIDRRADQIDR